MNNRTKEIQERFENSWNETKDFYTDLFDNYENFGFVEQILKFIAKVEVSGESRHFRIGTSVHTLIISRSVEDRLREDQKEIRIEWVNDLAHGYEYEVTMRQGKIIFRKYNVTDLHDEKVLGLINTLKETLVD